MPAHRPQYFQSRHTVTSGRRLVAWRCRSRPVAVTDPMAPMDQETPDGPARLARRNGCARDVPAQ